MAERELRPAAQAGACAAAQWTEHPDRRVTWCNAAYLGAVRGGRDNGTRAPGIGRRPGFSAISSTRHPPTATSAAATSSWATSPMTHWFEVSAMRVPGADRPVQRAAHRQAGDCRNLASGFRADLSKTFATFPSALPCSTASGSLSCSTRRWCRSMLEPGFLSRRPTLRSFLDQLREMRRMPEPRDYQLAGGNRTCSNRARNRTATTRSGPFPAARHCA
jgi:hypothetical protein